MNGTDRDRPTGIAEALAYSFDRILKNVNYHMISYHDKIIASGVLLS